jgi:hypothetical protein
MPHIQVLDWRDGRVICEGEYADVKELLEKNKDKISFNYAKLDNAKLNNAELNNAELNGAKLNYAELNGAKLNNAELNNAKLNGAKLNYAKLNGAKLNYAKLNNAKLNGADIDCSAWPLWCGSTQAIVDDRIKAQLLYHALCLVGDSVAIPQEIKGFVNSNFHRVKSGELEKL